MSGYSPHAPQKPSRFAVVAAFLLVAASGATQAQTQASQQPAVPPKPAETKPNILVVFGDDIGQFNVSAYSFGVVGTRRRTSTGSPRKA
jgi:hypothetical protein